MEASGKKFPVIQFKYYCNFGLTSYKKFVVTQYNTYNVISVLTVV